ncbi:MAG: RidA family protein [Caulobacteraceae bacterium]
MAQITTYDHGVPWELGHGMTQGYCVNGVIYISGQLAHDMNGSLVGEGDFEAQVRQTLANLDRVLAGFNVGRSNIAEFTIYLTSPTEQLETFGRLFKAYVGDHRSAATLIGVTALAFPGQLIEIRAVAHTD